MLLAVASDIHGNRHAFETVIAAAEAAGADELWCLGDLVGYGADPDACVALASERCGVVLAGNHDLAVTGALPLSDFSRGAGIAARWTREVIGPQTRAFLSGLAPQAVVDGLGLYHASPRDPVWEYVLSTLAAELCLDAAERRISLIGHSHVPLAFHRPEGEPASGSTRREGDALDLSHGEWLINPGGVAPARHGLGDRDLAPGELRHRGRRGRHPRRAPARVPRRPAVLRPVTCAPPSLRIPE